MDAFLAAVIDTILPGAAAAASGARAVPTGTQAAVRIDAAQPASAVLQSIAAQGGGADAFVGADEEQRIAVLEAVEREHATVFRALVTALLQDYYETEAVLAAFGTTTEPPQPAGRPVPPTDQPTLDLLDMVRERGPIWRPAE